MDQEISIDETPTQELPDLHFNAEQAALRDLEVSNDKAETTTGAGKLSQQEVQFTYVVVNH